ncbi:MAG TPA: glycosyltransferase, partial [Bacteroidales bacterium]|nr:glycosyltransferase [Bacteroidales bacterium]
MCKLSFISLSNELNKLSWSPDIIHAQATEDGGILANYLSEKLNVPYLITEHQLFLLQYYTNLKKYNISKAIEKAAKMIVVSEHQKRQILMTRIECDPVVLGNFVDDSLFTIGKTKKDVFNILVVTYPHYIKDNETLYKAIKRLLSEQIRDLKVRIVGGDLNSSALADKDNPLYKEAENYGITEYIEILNHVDREKMPEIINSCDVLVSTSIAETFGIACCEAMMCGVPVIATANGGIDEMISEKNGIKIPIRDEKALAAAIVQIKNKVITFNPDEIRNSVIDKFGRKAFKNKLSEIYDSV